MANRPATKGRNNIEAIKRHVPMEALLTELGATFPNWNGWTEFRSVFCPFHDESRNPSARFTETETEDGNPTGYFQCFNSACEIKGDQIEILVASGTVENVRQAIRWLLQHFGAPIERSLRSIAFPGTLPTGWYGDADHPTMEEWDAPCPTRFGPPSEWTQDQWTLVIDRWLPFAQDAVEKSKRFDGILARGEIDRVGMLSRGELQAVIRKSISHALLAYNPEAGARFSTFLHREVHDDVIDALRKEERARKHLVEDSGQDRRDQSPESRESFWAKIIDASYLLDIIAMRLGPEYARLAVLRGDGASQIECAATERVGRKVIRDREEKIKTLIHQVKGHEAVMYRQEVEKRYGDQRA
jgi:hypothetical protein